MKIPFNKHWSQSYFHSMYNVNFDRIDLMQVSQKAVSIYSNSNDADFGLTLSTFPFNGKHFILTSGDPFNMGESVALSKIAGAPIDINSNSDAVAWQERAYITTNDDLTYYTGSAWQTGLKALNSNVPHPLEVFDNKNSLAVGDKNTVILFNTAMEETVLTIPDRYQVVSLKYLNNNLYVGTKSLIEREAKVFIWNGNGTEAQAGYLVGASWALALEEYQSSIACLTSEGQLKRFTGGGFEPIRNIFGVEANLPVYNTKYRWIDSSTDTPRVHHRGLKADGDILYINLDGAVAFRDTYFHLNEQPSGIWCFDPNFGLYCRHLSTSDPLSTISVSSMANNVLTLASATKAKTGEPILISNAGSLTGISVRSTYYVIRLTSTTIQLAVTPASAKAGTAITLGGTAGSATIKVAGYTNYGQKSLSGGQVGAIGLIDSYLGNSAGSVFQEITTTTMIWGAKLGAAFHLNCLSTASNVGGFILNKEYSPQVKSAFQKIFVKYQNVNLDHEKIIFNARSKECFGLPTESVSGTFSTSRILGSSSALLGQVEEGDTINILSGNGSGQSVSIKSIDGLEFSLDEALDVSSADAVTFNVENFERVGEITENENFKQLPLENTSSWVQIMGEMRGQNINIEEIETTSSINQPSN